ncbi:MAG: lycopene cyclase domain-containing protein [Cyclobacteriaceae bacterium]|nr:lycopene cyclase domain-containing protein [Cyclobacteriaceae bacterium]
MANNYLYLITDLAALSIPFIASFYPKAPFYKEWNRFLKGLLLMGILFLPWDILYTHLGVWGFNDEYLTGIKLINLPIEEWLFFICIPYASVFTFFSLSHLVKSNPLDKYIWKINGSLIILLVVFTLLNYNKLYTSVTFILLAGLLIYHQLRKTEWLSLFYLSFIFILLPFFIVNGILTGSWIEGEIVWYNNLENIGFRMGTIPVEDTFYGMLMLLLTIWGFKASK